MYQTFLSSFGTLLPTHNSKHSFALLGQIQSTLQACKIKSQILHATVQAKNK
ncbi:uncharacterized protein DS421_15g513300 [Arachis hypogaea]|nr:uncharacterized protein DS421_15g513300 [Arachis hypogaea]